jgi:hypothetical protein
VTTVGAAVGSNENLAKGVSEFHNVARRAMVVA